MAQRLGQTQVFVTAYMVIWTLFGMAAYLVAAGAEPRAQQNAWPMGNGAGIGGVVLISAGLYQLSPLKGLYLSKCLTPLSFIMTSLRDGYGGTIGGVRDNKS